MQAIKLPVGRTAQAIFSFGDEQGGVRYDSTTQKLKRGGVLTSVVPHCDPTVNLYDCYHGVRGDTLEAICPSKPAVAPPEPGLFLPFSPI
jgi:D-serine deaminase-like pyridoxal phosphate-dependent protein